jgi:hypothetical protein
MISGCAGDDRTDGYEMTRGSRKHILDWASRSDFPVEFMKLIGLHDCVLSHPPIWQPKGYSDPEEACLEDCGKRFVPGLDCWSDLSAWWLVHRNGANTPNWDLVVACEVSDKRGLVLVEAKAHERELDWEGKRVHHGQSVNSAENHERIGKAISEASAGLSRIVPGVNISRDSHYQLANRLAYSWKLASMGIPVILLYLGFTGDDGIEDIGTPLRNHSHWEAIMRTYTAGILPDGFVGRSLYCEGEVGTLFHSLPSRHRPHLRLPASLLPFLLESCKKKDKPEE